MAQFTFETDTPRIIAACSLPSGNIAVAWRRLADGHVYTAVYNSSGTKVGGDTVLTTSTLSSNYTLGIGALSGGNYVVAHAGGAHNYSFSICSPVAAVVKATTAVAGGGAPTDDSGIGVIGLANAGFMLTCRRNGDGELATFDAAGTAVTAPTVFESGVEANIVAGALLDNGNVVISYEKVDGVTQGKFIIVDEAGTVTVAGPTVFQASATSSYAAPVVLGNGNFFIPYADNDGPAFGRFVIYTAAGVLVLGPTLFASEFVDDLTAILTSAADQVLIAWDGASSKGYYTVFDASGTLVTAKTAFETVSSIGTSTLSAATFGDNNDAILWRKASVNDGVMDIQIYTVGFSPPADIVTNKRLVAFSNDTLYYEDI